MLYLLLAYAACASALQPVARPSIPPAAVAPLDLCREAAKTKTADPDAVCEALLEVEKTMRAEAKTDDGALSRATLDALDGAWRLIFTTGTVETQTKCWRQS